MKSAESHRIAAVGEQRNESCPEVDGVAYMPGVYKMPMVRISSGKKTDESANVRF